MDISLRDFIHKYFYKEDIQAALEDIGESSTGNIDEIEDRLVSTWPKYRNVYDLLEFLDEEDLLEICYHFNIAYTTDSHRALKNRIKKSGLLGHTDSSQIMKKSKSDENKVKSKSNKVETQKQFQKLLWPPIVLLIICIIGIGFVQLNIFFVNDDKIIPFQRSYLFSNVEKENPNELPTSLLVMNYFFDMNGTVNLHTISRSAQNPIDVTIYLEPYNIDQSTPRPISGILPKTLHYIFPNAIEISDEPLDITLPKQVTMDLELKNDPLRYEGSKKIKYEDQGSYDFYLRERTDMQKGSIEEGFLMEYEFNIHDDKKIFMAELKNTGNEKIIVGPYSQTLDAEGRKTAWFFGLSSTAVASFGIIITILMINKKNSS